MGKGSKRRPGDERKYRAHYGKIFGIKAEEVVLAKFQKNNGDFTEDAVRRRVSLD